MAARSNWLRRLLLTLPALLLVFAGCGGETIYQVSGEVKYDGQPVSQGLIRFIPEGEGQAQEAVITDGKYTAEVSPGSKKVAIYGNRKIGEQRGMGPDSPMVDITEQYIPMKYNDQTTLTEEITGGDDAKNFDLQP